MAKHKKHTKRKNSKADKEAPKQQNYFWRQVVAFVLIIVALFTLMGGFGWGGALPVKLFTWAAWTFGFIAYLLPLVVLFWAWAKLKNEKHKIPLSKLFSSLFFLLSLSGMVHVFVDREDSAAIASEGYYGGQVGHWASGALLNFFSSMTALVTFFVLAWIAFMVMFGIAPKNMLKRIINLFRRNQQKDTDFNSLNGSRETNFQIHEGVPVVHHDKQKDDKPLRIGGLKQSAKLAPIEDHAALTATSDPNWKFPTINLLNQKQDKADPGDTKARAEIIKSTLAGFGIEVEMEGANVGPRVTQYTLLPSSGQKLSKITSHEQDIAYELAATNIRIEAPIPGKRAVGIEVPNKQSATVRMASIINSPEWAAYNKPLTFAVGKDISGKPVIASLEKMPHILIAGQTNSGKSVMINDLLVSLLFRNSPSDLKLILIDPKQVELMPYFDIPHLLTPVITDVEKCVSALKWSVAEMERRLRTFADEGRRNISEYNSDKKETRMPYIVIVIDEMADFMMAAGRDLEALIARIAQKARAAGIHLVLATQRPSVNVITGLIKANVPSRIAFTVFSLVDSRVIIDQSGAEKLLGAGDMLYVTTDIPKPIRLQGALIETDETKKVTEFLRQQREPQYNDEVVSMPVQLSGGRGSMVPENYGSSADDDMWHDAVRVVIENGKASTSLLQRRLRIGYGRASRMIDEMEERGIVGPADGARPREILVRDIGEVFGGSSGDDEDVAIGHVTHIPISDDPRDEYLTR